MKEAEKPETEKWISIWYSRQLAFKNHGEMGVKALGNFHIWVGLSL
jgi:hypothetical protein